MTSLQATAPSLAEFNLGERLRQLREAHGLSQRALATRAGVANGIISMIEQNRSSPSVATLKKILDGIPLSLGAFFGADLPVQEPVVYRAHELTEIGRPGLSYRQVGRNLQSRAIQLMHERLEPGADSGDDMLRHDSEEGGIVLRGHLELTVGEQVWELGPGDAYYFDSRHPHRFRALGSETVEVVSACTPPSF
ncbi:cupin domain-containing protein [Plasticicumulans acidivorans]|uniref:XRE family transcriptional regulator n=1 Tax=Plasticicumulans acidivorans TaxID=886464 RepID=A0A317MQZ5_9GAMM|nr:cupin domain-containing protein [Plasticicumulans acidivorans]PWV59111.1 XRE family transcriptional regulator [Plasticicumulans acidivorans]